jgi:biotin operon repressor
MKPGLQYFRADLTRALGLSTAQWNAAIRELLESGKVVRSGDKRGARYSLPQTGPIY